MEIRTFHLQPRSRLGAIALTVGVVGIGAVLLVLGLTLLLAFAAVGIVAGVATVLYRRLTGRSRPAPVYPENREYPSQPFLLDPRMEIPAPTTREHGDDAPALPRATDE